MKRLLILCAVALTAVAIYADVVSDARELISDGKWNEAANILTEELEINPSGPNVGTVSAMLGECYFKLGDFDAALRMLETAKKRGVADASLWLGRIALKDYDFVKAASLYDSYIKLKTNAKKEVDPMARKERAGIDKAKEAVQRVEMITIIDSVTVPKKDFFKWMRISPAVGRLRSPEQTPVAQYGEDAEVVFINENSDNMLWAMTDTLGHKRIVESIKLTDGSWHTPEYTPEILNGNGDADYPFMMPDGLTLYFANNGDDSMGGYDIFVASRDAVDGSWLSPQNIGMPYNSPFDDYMLALDEVTGVGWWVTDRKLLPDSLTMYVYIPNERRIIWSEDMDDPLDFAKITDISLTQDPEDDYQSIFESIRSIDPEWEPIVEEFRFRLPDGVLLTRYDELNSNEAREAMRKYLEGKSLYDESCSKLDELRKDYHIMGATSALKLQISDLENSVLRQKSNLQILKNNVIQATGKFY
ncbi:MAG: tetratricopeptide repeat protein [Prevotella sp.]|nr:tetratricopeptide repeat protein [Bacteroides sp.]MCM1366103.1 tetratricopeptide repeat protein [Prevotella sp.]MCM1436588.1 tetratricopeptide repeat protein [Prevotella sp.]